MERNSMCMNDGKTHLPIVLKSADAIVDKCVIRVGVVTSRCVQCLGVCVDTHLDIRGVDPV